MKQMDKKVLLVTGASRGIGKAIAIEFAKEKYIVVVNYKNDENSAKDVVDSIIKSKGEAFSIKADVSCAGDVNNMVEEIIKKLYKIDVLINNAGIICDSLIINMDEKKWDIVLNTNLKSVFLCCKAVSKHMIKNKRGSIINVSSIVGVRGNFGQANYSGSKAAILGFTKSLAKELGKFNIRVNAILPGYHLTDLTNKYPATIIRAKEESVLNKLADLKEVAKFVVFLAGLKSISGQVFNIDSRII